MPSSISNARRLGCPGRVTNGFATSQTTEVQLWHPVGQTPIRAFTAVWTAAGPTSSQIVSLAKSRTIIEMEFHRTDMLSARMIAMSDLRPFTQVRRVHFLKCRFFTMDEVGCGLRSFRSNQPDFDIVFTPTRPEIRELYGESWHGAVLCYLFLWRHNRPNKFITNLLHDIRFRTTTSSGMPVQAPMTGIDS